MRTSPPESSWVVFAPEPFPESALGALPGRFQLRQGRHGRAFTEDELVDAVGDVDALAINSRDPITARVLAAAPRLRVIAKAGSRPSSNVDIAAAERSGVRVLWTPGANAVSVAEMAMAMMLTVAKRLPEVAARLRGGGWRSHDLLGSEIAGKTLGLVGLGAIGREVAQRFRAFGGHVVGYDPVVDEATAARLGVQRLPLESVYACADFVSLHCEMNVNTAHLINAQALAAMKPRAVLINTARGGLIDEPALLQALNAGTLAGAALDVFAEEPPAADHPLLHHPCVYATPHVAAFTREASLRESSWALEDLARVLDGLEPLHH